MASPLNVESPVAVELSPVKKKKVVGAVNGAGNKKKVKVGESLPPVIVASA